MKELLEDDDCSLQSTQVQNALRTVSAILKWTKQPKH